MLKLSGKLVKKTNPEIGRSREKCCNCNQVVLTNNPLCSYSQQRLPCKYRYPMHLMPFPSDSKAFQASRTHGMVFPWFIKTSHRGSFENQECPFVDKNLPLGLMETTGIADTYHLTRCTNSFYLLFARFCLRLELSHSLTGAWLLHRYKQRFLW